MSDAAEPIELDESILNHEENHVDNNIDLNDDQIALLLGDREAEVLEETPKEDAPREDDNSDILVDEEKSAPKAIVVEDEVIHEVDDDVIHDVAEDAVHEKKDETNGEVATNKEEVLMEHPEALKNDSEIVLDDDDVIVEKSESVKKAAEKEKSKKTISLEDLGGEVLMNHPDSDDDLIIDESANQEVVGDDQKGNNNHKDEDSSVSRKRANSNGALRSPVPKRKRRVHTYFATRQAAINLVTQILGSYDGTLYRKDLQLLTDFNVINKEQMLRANQDHVKRLRTENKKLREQLSDEKRAHQVTLRKLLSIDKEMQDMRDSLKALMPMLTQPSTPEVEQRQFPKHFHMPPPQQQRMHVPADRISIPATQPQRQFVQRRVPAPATSSGNFYVPSAQPASVTPMRIMPQATQYRPVATPPVRRVAQRGGPPTWQHIPLPTTNLGHDHAINTLAVPQNMKDDTDTNNSNTIMLCVPYIQPARIFPFIDRPAMIPHRFKSLTPSAHLSVVINSTAADFRDNWQIGGRVSYEKLKNLHKKKIQVFVQVASFKACGMGAHLPMSNDPIEWGISSAWPCKPKMHKFRIRFHQQQQIPQDDRVTVFAVAWSDNGTIDISVPATVVLS